jgi:ribosomal protein S18 acetylase RimI-like enzyme
MESLNIKTDYYIEYIYVHKNFRGRNIGSYLLKNMENIITKMGYKKIVTYSQGYEDHVDIVYSFNLKNGFRDTVDGASELGYDFITIYMEKDL